MGLREAARATMSASVEVSAIDEFLAAAPASLRQLANELIGFLRKMHPGAYVTAWPRLKIVSFGFGPKKLSEHYFYIAMHRKRVNAGFYYGASLPDPSLLLEGTGKNLRHVKVHTLQEARAASLLALLAAAKE